MERSRGLFRPIAALAAGSAAVFALLLALGWASGSPAALSPPTFGAEVNVFQKAERDTGFDLDFGWRDFRHNTQAVRLSVAKRELAEAEAEFGYTDAELEAYLQAHLDKMARETAAALRAFVEAEIKRSRHSRFLGVTDQGPLAFTVDFYTPPEDVREAARKDFLRITSALAKEQERLTKKMEKDIVGLKAAFFEGRGIRLAGREMTVAYGICALRNRPRMRPSLEALRRAAPKLGLYDFLALLVAFVQEVPFVKPPMTEGERMILEFWVPSRILVENGGDCDSKGVALAALWKNFRTTPLLLFKVPDHVFLGIAVPSPTTEGTVTIGGLRYTLCEVTGQDLLPPGFISSYSRMYLEGGRYDYERID
jgi:hypothetical protein